MKKQLSLSLAAATLSAGLAAPAMAEVPGLSANVGFLSDYYYRGVHLGQSSPYAGLDYEVAGFYVGTWAVDDGVASGNDGLEVDYYFGYGMEHGDFSWSVGFTGYEYTYTENSEAEIGFSLAYQGFSLNYYVGEDNNPTAFDNLGNSVGGDDMEDHDYQFFTLGWAGEVFGVTYGNYKVTDVDKSFGKNTPNVSGYQKDDGYQYLELSAGGELGGFDVAATLGRQFEAELSDATATSGGGEYIVLDVSKSFSF
jgi:uncharacterized protein (TIGR02001 family)